MRRAEDSSLPGLGLGLDLSIGLGALCVPSFVRYLYGERLRAINASMQVIEYWILMTPATRPGCLAGWLTGIQSLTEYNCGRKLQSQLKCLRKCNALPTPGARSIRSRRSILLSSDCHWTTDTDIFQTQTQTQTHSERLTALCP